MNNSCEVIKVRELSGKMAVVTGANRGIGKEITKIFAENGANIFACMRKFNEQIENELSSISKKNQVEIIPIYFDLSENDNITTGIKEINQYNKKLDILVNCAGIADAGTINQTTIKRLKEVFQINYFAQIQIIQLVSRIMIRRKVKGSIINIASVGGIEANAGYLSYGSSKASLIWATRAISKELGQFGIRVNAVAPGMTNTDMAGVFKTEEQLNQIIKRTGLKRIGNPREIAEAVLFLASDKSSFITGDILSVDGGRI